MPARAPIEAVATDPSIYEPLVGPVARAVATSRSWPQPGRALVVFLDLPLLTDDAAPYAPYAAAYADPWPGSVLLYRSATNSDYALDTTLTQSRHASARRRPISIPARVALGPGQHAVGSSSIQRHAVVGRRPRGARRRQCARRAERGWRMGDRAVRHRHADRAERMDAHAICCAAARHRRRDARSGRGGARVVVLDGAPSPASSAAKATSRCRSITCGARKESRSPIPPISRRRCNSPASALRRCRRMRANAAYDA